MPWKATSSVGSKATTIRGGEEGSLGAPACCSGGGGFRSKYSFTACEGAGTGFQGPATSSASYQNVPPASAYRLVSGSSTTKHGVFTTRMSFVPSTGRRTGSPSRRTRTAGSSLITIFGGVTLMPAAVCFICWVWARLACRWSRETDRSHSLPSLERKLAHPLSWSDLMFGKWTRMTCTSSTVTILRSLSVETRDLNHIAPKIGSGLSFGVKEMAARPPSSVPWKPSIWGW